MQLQKLSNKNFQEPTPFLRRTKMAKKRAGIVVDDYKLTIFRKNLKAAGFKFNEKKDNSLPAGTSALFVDIVDTNDIQALSGVVKQSNKEARKRNYG